MQPIPGGTGQPRAAVGGLGSNSYRPLTPHPDTPRQPSKGAFKVVTGVRLPVRVFPARAAPGLRQTDVGAHHRRNGSPRSVVHRGATGRWPLRMVANATTPPAAQITAAMSAAC